MIMRKKTMITASLAILLAAMIFGIYDYRGEAADEYIYEVLTRANMRKEPSVEGQWVMTVPDGALVTKIGTETNGYSLIEYLGTKGYVYSTCLKLSGEQTEVEAPVRNSAAASIAATRKNTSVDAAMAVPAGNGSTAVSAMGRAISNSSTPKVEIMLPVTANVNFRAKPSSNGERLMMVSKGTEVIYLDDGENGYYHVRYQGQTGYIYARSVDNASLANSKTEALTSVLASNVTRPVESGRSANMMRAMQNSGIIPESQKMTTTATEAMTKETAVTPQVQVNRPPAVTPEISYQIGAMTSMRSTPDEADNMMATLPMGADVVVLGSQGGYTMVQYDGMVGYVLGEHVVDSVDYAKLNGQAVLFTCTAYCTCQKCCGQFSPEVTGREAHTATGTVPTQGRTIAVDPSVIPYGSRVSIEGMGTYIAEDCGGGVKRDHIDIFFDTHEQAVAFGTKRLYVTIEPK